jgi:hypothetical protein
MSDAVVISAIAQIPVLIGLVLTFFIQRAQLRRQDGVLHEIKTTVNGNTTKLLQANRELTRKLPYPEEGTA